jgi:hypothetical protein
VGRIHKTVDIFDTVCASYSLVINGERNSPSDGFHKWPAAIRPPWYLRLLAEIREPTLVLAIQAKASRVRNILTMAGFHGRKKQSNSALVLPGGVAVRPTRSRRQR